MNFINACKEGRLDKVVELINDKVNVHAYNGKGFRWICENGHLEVIKYLMLLNDKPNIHAYNENGFRSTCKNEHNEVTEYYQQYVMNISDSFNVVV